MGRVTTTDDLHLTPLRPTDALVFKRWLGAFLRVHNRSWASTLDLRWSPSEIDAQMLAADLVEEHWARLVRAAERHETQLVRVARAGDRPVGVVWAGVTWHDYLKRHHGVLNWVFVDRGARGRGVASLLLEHAKGWMRARGLDSVEVSVLADNEAALRLYRRAGLLPADVRLMGTLRDER